MLLTLSTAHSNISETPTTPCEFSALPFTAITSVEMTLAKELLAVVEAFTSLDANIRSTYQGIIASNTTDLDGIFSQSKTAESSARRASLACAATQLIFGAKTIAPGVSTYVAEQKRNWFDYSPKMKHYYEPYLLSQVI